MIIHSLGAISERIKRLLEWVGEGQVSQRHFHHANLWSSGQERDKVLKLTIYSIFEGHDRRCVEIKVILLGS